jgi:hypothetical protein
MARRAKRQLRIVAHLDTRLARVFSDAQQKCLQERVGEDLFVASYTAYRLHDGRPVSRAAWSENVPTLLPKTDELAFVLRPGTDTTEVVTVPWDDAERIVEDLLERDPTLNPSRWRTLGWPDEAMLDELRRRASS